jgi:hypothetical protein
VPVCIVESPTRNNDGCAADGVEFVVWPMRFDAHSGNAKANSNLKNLRPIISRFCRIASESLS